MTGEVRFPQKTELAFGADLTADPSTWVWTEMTGDNALPRQTIAISSGRSDESAEGQPSSIQLELKNKNGWLTPRNPVSQWYPNVRRGTPLRHSVKAGSPHLTVTGTATSLASTPDDSSLDITGDWFLVVEAEPPSPGAESKLIGKWNPTGDQRSILFTALLHSSSSFSSALLVEWSPDGTAASTRLLATSFPPPPLLWGPVAYGVWLDVDNGAGGVTATFYAAPAIEALLVNPNAWLVGPPRTGAGTSSVFSSSAPLEVGGGGSDGVAALWAGNIRRAQVRAGDSSGSLRAAPDFTTQSLGATSFTDAAGRPWTVSGATIDNWHTRFVGQIDVIAPHWVDGDPDGGQRVSITASGSLRRLTQGAKSLDSVLFRDFMKAKPWTAVTDLKAYWPFEDSRDATSVASPVSGVKPATIASVSLSADDTLDASLPLANIAGGTLASWVAEVPSFTATSWVAELFMNAATLAVSPSWTPLWTVGATGTVRRWSFEANTTTIRLRGFDAGGTEVVNGSGAATIAGTWRNLAIKITQNGGNIDWEIDQFDLAGNGTGQTGSLAGTAGRPTDVAYLETAPSGGISFGHVAVLTNRDPGWHGPSVSQGHNGESALNRVKRLCDEEGVPVMAWARQNETVPVSALMGPQRADTLVNLLQECADADLGILCEQRHRPGLAYRVRTTLYNQTPALDVDTLSKGLVNPFEPVLDDQRLRNDITVSRVNGSSATVVDQASISAEGRYQESPPALNVQADSQLPDLAGWELHRGTWPDLRYPSLSFKLGTQTERRGLLDGWLGAGLGDIARVSQLPSHHPAGPVDQIIEHITEKIGSFRWDVEVTGSPAGVWDVGVLPAGVSALKVTGTAGDDATTPDHANFDTDDINLRMRVAMDDWTPGGFGRILIDQQPAAGNNAWAVSVTATGQLNFTWSTDGTNSFSATTTNPLGFPDGTEQWIGVAFDADNGAAGRTIVFEASSDRLTWTTIQTVVQGTATSIFNSTGTIAISRGLPFAGYVRTVIARNGPTPGTGTIIFNPDFSAQTEGTTSFADTAPTPKTWTVNNNATIRVEVPDDNRLQRLATNGSTLSVGIDTDDLSLSIASTNTDLPLWITTSTHPGHFPLRITIGDEEMVISGISGSSSPQTFTVSQRAANGVSKSHSSGAAVQVADPIVLAL